MSGRSSAKISKSAKITGVQVAIAKGKKRAPGSSVKREVEEEAEIPTKMLASKAAQMDSMLSSKPNMVVVMRKYAEEAYEAAVDAINAIEKLETIEYNVCKELSGQSDDYKHGDSHCFEDMDLPLDDCKQALLTFRKRADRAVLRFCMDDEESEEEEREGGEASGAKEEA